MVDLSADFLAQREGIGNSEKWQASSDPDIDIVDPTGVDANDDLVL
jgi:hypothetical protein